MKQIKSVIFGAVQLYVFSGLGVVNAANTIHVYGAESGCYFQSRGQASYILHLAAFTSKDNALHYKNQIARQTRQSVHWDYEFQKKAPYLVTLGPFSSIDALRKTSCTLFAPSRPVAAVYAQPSLQTVAAIKTAQPSITSYVGKMGVSPKFYPWSKVATLSLGSAWADPHPTETITLRPNLKNNYVGAPRSQAVVDGEIFVGVQRAINRNFLGQIGVAVAAASHVQLDGDVIGLVGSSGNNFLYAYDINHTHIAVKAKVLAEPEDIVSPYVSGSLGVGLNHAYDYSIEPKHANAGLSPLFESNTLAAFTYTLGAGVQTDINANWQVGVGYEFADWGKSGLSQALSQSIGSGLQLNHLYTNALQFNLTYSGFL